MKTAKILVVKKYSEWLMGKFTEWEKAQRSRQSYSAFARYLGVKQSSLSQWIAGNYPPGGENLQKIATKLGYEIYDVLGISRPETGEEELARQHGVPPEARDEFVQDTRAFIERWFLDHGWMLDQEDSKRK